MNIAEIFKQYLEHLFAGNRWQARDVVLSAQDRGIPASKLLKTIVWPSMEQVDKLYRNHHINTLVEHMASRINRMVADQLQNYLLHQPKNGKRMIVTCGQAEGDELAAQITADLFEAEGWTVYFLGAGVPNDEILQMIGNAKPDVLTICGAEPGDVPNLRHLIELIRDVGSCENLQVLTLGGVFSRAEGLSEEIRADLNADGVTEALKVVNENPVRVALPDAPQPGRRRKRKRTAGRPSKPKTAAPISGQV